MNQSDVYETLTSTIQSALGVLELPPTDPLRQDVQALSDRASRSVYRIAVFAPFNYGKSTLLNALLGERTLPIDLIPTTGAAIRVGYGDSLTTTIQFNDGNRIQSSGTDILKQYAILDDQRRMRDDVASVEVQCPHPWLKTGVELLDLPGTDDREAQDALVKHQLLTADLIVQVLDGRKLMTLGEREHLRDWLLDRGIHTVVFVVNFLNLLEPDDQKQVYNRLRFVAESFRSALPDGVSNLYRVDALPALRARLKGDHAAAQHSGLPILESALQTIVTTQTQSGSPLNLTRWIAIARPVQEALQQKLQTLTQTLTAETQSRMAQRAEVQRKAQTLIRQGFDRSVAQMRSWLSLSNLNRQYDYALVDALRRFEFSEWERLSIRADWEHHKRAVVEWVYKACDFFDYPRPADMWMTFPPEPTVTFPAPSSPTSTRDGSPAAPVAIATGLGWVMGGPVGAAVLGGASYLLNKLDQSTEPSIPPPPPDVDRLSQQAAQTYLRQVSQAGLQALDQYCQTADRVLTIPTTSSSAVTPAMTHQLQLVQSTLDTLTEAIAQATCISI